jgi:hypothetical protein
LLEPLLGDAPKTIGLGAVETFSEKSVAATSTLESTTFAPKENEPAIVGIPLIAPVDEFSVRPLGNSPLVLTQE